MNKVHKLSLTAALALALALTFFGCSSDDMPDLPPPDGCHFGEQSGSVIQLDVIYRDFNSSEDWIQTYDQSRGDQRRCAEVPSGGNGWGNDDNIIANMAYDYNRICFSNGTYHSCEKGGTQLRYGGANCDNGPRGYTNVPAGMPGAIASGSNERCWDQAVLVTRHMTEKKLDYSQCTDGDGSSLNDWIGDKSDPEYIRGRYCARPVPNKDPAITSDMRCYGDNLHLWFTDGGGAKRINDVLKLERLHGNTYGVEYNYNKQIAEWDDNGFFPLDKYSDDLVMTWGRQNRNARDPYNQGSDGTIKGGQAYPAGNKYHNFGFTMASSAEFKYYAAEEAMLEFVGDDDMWIFIDGVLFYDEETGEHADLGGPHLAAPAMINIQRWGQKQGWKEGSTHVINLFYVERQTDGSNLKLSLSLSGLKNSCF